MRTALLAVLAGFGLVAFATAAQAGPHLIAECPAEARSAVTYTGEPGWTATNQSSRVVGARVETIGTERALVCIYAMFGTEYWIYRRADPALPVCRVVSYRPFTFDCALS